jgi:hypothetical protein
MISPTFFLLGRMVYALSVLSDLARDKASNPPEGWGAFGGSLDALREIKRRLAAGDRVAWWVNRIDWLVLGLLVVFLGYRLY